MDTEQRIQRVAINILKSTLSSRREELRCRLEGLAVLLIEEFSGGDYRATAITAAKIEGLLLFGKSIYEIEPISGNSILEELKTIKERLYDIAVSPYLGEKRQEALAFSSHQGVQGAQKEETGKEMRQNEAKLDHPVKLAKKRQEDRERRQESDSDEETIEAFDNAAKRQSAIIEKIRQTEGVPLPAKDLSNMLPTINPRTLRYDLQKLCRDGLIMRIGTGGPNTSYQIRVL